MRPSRRILGYAFTSTSSALQKAITRCTDFSSPGPRAGLSLSAGRGCRRNPHLSGAYDCKVSRGGLSVWAKHPSTGYGRAASIMENGRPSGVKHRMMCVGIPSSVMADYKQWECSYENSASHLNLLSDLKLCRCEV